MSFLSELDSYIARFECSPVGETENHPVAASPAAGMGLAAMQGAEQPASGVGPGGFDVPFAAAAERSRFSPQPACTPSMGPTRAGGGDPTREHGGSDGFELRYLQPSPAQADMRRTAGATDQNSSTAIVVGAQDTPERQPQPQPTLSALAHGRTGWSPHGSPAAELSEAGPSVNSVPQEGPPRDAGASSRGAATDEQLALLEEHKSMLLSPFSPALTDESRTKASSVGTPTPLREFKQEQSAQRRELQAWLEPSRPTPDHGSGAGAVSSGQEQSPGAPLQEYVAQAHAQRARLAQELGASSLSPALAAQVAAPEPAASPAPPASSQEAECNAAPSQPEPSAPRSEAGTTDPNATAAAAAAAALPLLLSMLQQQQQQQQRPQPLQWGGAVSGPSPHSHASSQRGTAAQRQANPAGKPPLGLRRAKRSPHRAEKRTASRLTTAKPPRPPAAPQGRVAPARDHSGEKATSGPSLRGGHARGAPTANAEPQAQPALRRRRRERLGAGRLSPAAVPAPTAAAPRHQQSEQQQQQQSDHEPRSVTAVRDASVETTPSLAWRHTSACPERVGGAGGEGEECDGERGPAPHRDAAVATSPAAPPSSSRGAPAACSGRGEGGQGSGQPRGESPRSAPAGDGEWHQAEGGQSPDPAHKTESSAGPERSPCDDGAGHGIRDGEGKPEPASPLADLAHSMRFRLDEEQLRYLEAALRLLARAGVLHSAWGEGGASDLPYERKGGDSLPASAWRALQAGKLQRIEAEPGPSGEEQAVDRPDGSASESDGGLDPQAPSKLPVGGESVPVAYSAASPAVHGHAQTVAQSPAAKAATDRGGMRYPSEERVKSSPEQAGGGEFDSPATQKCDSFTRHVDVLAAKAAQALATPQSAPWFRDLLSSVTDSMRDGALSPPSADPAGRGAGVDTAGSGEEGTATASLEPRQGRDIAPALSAARYNAGPASKEEQGEDAQHCEPSPLAQAPTRNRPVGNRPAGDCPSIAATGSNPGAAPTAEELLAAVLQSPSVSPPARSAKFVGSQHERKEEEEDEEEKKQEDEAARVLDSTGTPVGDRGRGARCADTPPSQLEELLSRSFQMLASEKRKLGAAVGSHAGSWQGEHPQPGHDASPAGPAPMPQQQPAPPAADAGESPPREGEEDAPAAGATPRDAAPVRRALQFTPTIGARPSPRPTPEEVSVSPTGAWSSAGTATPRSSPLAAATGTQLSTQVPGGQSEHREEVPPTPQGSAVRTQTAGTRPPSPSPFAAYAPASRGTSDRVRSSAGRPPSGRRRERRAPSPVPSRLLQPTASSAAKRRVGCRRGAKRGTPGAGRRAASAERADSEDGTRPSPAHEARGAEGRPSGTGSAGGGADQDPGQDRKGAVHEASSSWGVPTLSASPAPSTGFPTARDEGSTRSGCSGSEDAPCPPLPDHDRFVLVVSDPCVPLRPLCGALQGCALDALLVSSPVDVVQLMEEGKAAAGKPIAPRAVLVDTALSPTTVFRCAAAVRSAAADARPPLIAVRRRTDWLTALARVSPEDLANGTMPSGVSPLVARIAASKGIDAAREQRQRAIEAAGFAASLDEAADVEACLAALEQAGVDVA